MHFIESCRERVHCLLLISGLPHRQLLSNHRESAAEAAEEELSRRTEQWIAFCIFVTCGR